MNESPSHPPDDSADASGEGHGQATDGPNGASRERTSKQGDPESGGVVDEVDPDLVGFDADPDAPIMATLAESGEGDSAGVRIGSPFAVDPLPYNPDRPIEQVIDGGPLRYTATGAVAAAAMVLVFAAAAAWWFPAGGTMIAALGCLLSVFGLYSAYRYTSASFLLFNLALFVLCYGRTIS